MVSTYFDFHMFEFLESLDNSIRSFFVLSFNFSHDLLGWLVFVFLVILSHHKIIFQRSKMIDQEFLELMRILFYLFFQHCHFLDKVGEIFAEYIMLLWGGVHELLRKWLGTSTDSRWVFALPDCSPIVLEMSLLLDKRDILYNFI